MPYDTTLMAEIADIPTDEPIDDPHDTSVADATPTGAADLYSRLQAIACGAAGESPRWWRMWSCAITHPWYERQLRSIAAKVARWVSSAQAAQGDLEQGVILLLARDLQRDASRHHSLLKNPARFAGLMSCLMYRQCLQVCRSQRNADRRTLPLWGDLPAAGDGASIALRIDLAMCLEKLAPELRRAVGLYTQGFTQQEIAQLENVTQATISRRLNRAVHRLRRCLHCHDEAVETARHNSAIVVDE